MIGDSVLYGTLQAQIAGVDFIKVELSDCSFGIVNLRANRRPNGAKIGDPVVLQYHDGWTAEGSLHAKETT